jgi:tRNA U55 pseudouridine synthase TruB
MTPEVVKRLEAAADAYYHGYRQIPPLFAAVKKAAKAAAAAGIPVEVIAEVCRVDRSEIRQWLRR